MKHCLRCKGEMTKIGKIHIYFPEKNIDRYTVQWHCQKCNAYRNFKYKENPTTIKYRNDETYREKHKNVAKLYYKRKSEING